MQLSLDQALQRGIEAHKAGKIQEADRYYSAILKVQPKHPNANHNLGVLGVSTGNVEKALPFLRVASEASPDTAQFWLSYIYALINLKRVKDAKAVFDQAEAKGAKGNKFYKLKQILNGTSEISTETTTFVGIESLTGGTISKETNAQEPPRYQMQNLVNHYNQGNMEAAFQEAQALKEQYPSSSFIWNILGSSAGQLGHLTLACHSLKKAIALKPDDAEAYSNLGILFQKDGQLEEAITAFTRVLDIQPDYVDTHYNTGLCLQELGRQEEAIASFRKALIIKPDYAAALHNIAIINQEQGKLAEAIVHYNKALALNPNYIEAHYNVGVLHQEKGELAEAVVSYNKVLAINSDYIPALQNLGVSLRDQGKLEAAIEAFSKANFLIPDFYIQLSLSELLLRAQKDPADALTLLESALAIKPTDTRSIAYKFIALRGLNKFVEANQLIGFERFVSTENLQRHTNKDISDFNKQLLCALDEHPRRAPELDARGWAIRGGTAIRKLFSDPDPVIRDFEQMLRKSIENKIASLSDDNSHPFLMGKPTNYEIHCWANLLEAGDYQSNHIHNNGWMSGVYYVSIPDIDHEEPSNAGWIEFNRAGYDLPHFGGENSIETIQPKPGLLIFFPSYVWHGTIPFKGAKNRVSISFDVQIK